MNEIKYNKGNIPINKDLLNKYANVREIFDNESNNCQRYIKLNSNIPELINLKVRKLTSKEAKLIAKNIFNQYHSTNEFFNNGNKIIITGRGIEESINKIFNSSFQRSLLKIHLLIISNLGYILEQVRLINQIKERKERTNINMWNYYFIKLKINNIYYVLELDIRSMDSGQNQYRVQRIEKNKNR